MSDANTLSKAPVPDRAERDAFFPSPFSLSEFTAPTTGAAQPHYSNPYKGPLKVLMIGTQERYLPVTQGRYFSTGNHPVETLLPIAHFLAAGFDVDVATVSGDHVKFENWAFPEQDPVVKGAYDHLKARFENPLDLRKVVRDGGLEKGSYAALFVPGGHGALNDLPLSRDVGTLMVEALKRDRFVVTLCHGPGSLLSAAVAQTPEESPVLAPALNFANPEMIQGLAPNPFKGYETCVFPDAIDNGILPEIGYLPAPMRWLAGDALAQAGLKVLPSPKLGRVHRDRHLLTGDSPLAAEKLGELAAATLLEAYGA
ncbi:protein deglycase HchA [Formicincola oecophyllae]|uniref:Protein deglycase HchA n=1 Tax=Formicincola oecophyllae TaxID=2558361 RepID=A0A4Y6UAW1_9PROT|nr:DJ-1/PfpI family protein [Formicincola oecophyllae]QDH13265.1 protein deglycase HchA [Formicincola oecophyllae]